MIWIPMTVNDRLDTRLPIGFATHPLAEGLRNRLKETGLYAPGVERVDKDYPNNVRFFHGEDRELAQRVATVAEQFLSERKNPKKLELQDLSGKGFKVQKGHVEVWINLARP
jgi:hypothetical protein